MQQKVIITRHEIAVMSSPDETKSSDTGGHNYKNMRSQLGEIILFFNIKVRIL